MKAINEMKCSCPKLRIFISMIVKLTMIYVEHKHSQNVSIATRDTYSTMNEFMFSGTLIE